MTFMNAWKALGIAGLFVLNTSVASLAQDTAEPETGSAEDELSLGEDANASPAPGQPYVAEKIGDWDLRCIKSDAETDPCQMYQLLVDANETPIAEVSLFRLPDGGRAEAGATVVVPLETALQQQLTIVVDSGSARRYPFAFCNRVGCYARIGLTSEDVSAFKRGNAATVSIVPMGAPDQKVEVKMSLTGFTAAFGKVSVLNQ
jgi:invasion protein IalB